MIEYIIVTIAFLILIYIVVVNLIYLRQHDNKLENNLKHFENGKSKPIEKKR